MKRTRFQMKEEHRWDSYENFIKDQGFDIILIEGDGNCLFRSISHQLEGSESNYKHYRQEATKFITQHPENFNNFLLDDDPHNGRLDEYAKYMSQDGIWGGNFEIYALAQALHVNICLFQENRTILTIRSSTNTSTRIKTLYLAYNRSHRHYNSVIKAQQGNNATTERVLRRITRTKPVSEVTTTVKPKKKVIKNRVIKEIANNQVISPNIAITKKSNPNKETQLAIKKEDKMIEEKEINFQKILTLCDKELILWALDNQLLREPHCCKECRNKENKKVKMKLSQNKNYVDGFVWKCKCGGMENIRKGNNLFENFKKIKLRLILIYIFTHFTILLSPTISQTILGLNPRTIRRLADYLSSCIIKHQINDEESLGKFGGKDVIIEMDESCFFKRKNNKGRIQKQIWGFGFVERGSGRLFVEAVPNRTSKTLLPSIFKWISPDTKLLITDEWRAYKN